MAEINPKVKREGNSCVLVDRTITKTEADLRGMEQLRELLNKIPHSETLELSPEAIERITVKVGELAE
jgi:hypothetical protein